MKWNVGIPVNASALTKGAAVRQINPQQKMMNRTGTKRVESLKVDRTYVSLVVSTGRV